MYSLTDSVYKKKHDHRKIIQEGGWGTEGSDLIPAGDYWLLSCSDSSKYQKVCLGPFSNAFLEDPTQYGDICEESKQA